MQGLLIRRLDSGSRSDIRSFIDLPKWLYRGNEQFVPWFDRGMRRILKKEHPFFEHSSGEFFLAERDGSIVGRIALLRPERFNSYQGRKDCRIYFLDFIDDQTVCHALLDHASAWAGEQGLTRIIGPQGFSGFTGAGILIQGFEHTATMTMMNYHYRYYQQYIEAYGFTKYKDFYSAELRAETMELPEQIDRIQRISRRRNELSVRTIGSRKELRTLAYKIMEIYNSSFVTHEEFCPMTERELEETIADLLTVTDPQLVKVVEHAGEPAGFLLTFPDLSETLRRAGGRLDLLKMIRLMYAKGHVDRYIINGIGILPEYQSRGGMAVLYYELFKTLSDRGAESAEMTQIAETTDAMMKSMEKLEADVYKVHRIYQLKL